MSHYYDYEINVNYEKQDINNKAWDLFVNGKVVDSSLKTTEEVYSGWKRSQDYKVNPYQKFVSNVLSEHELLSIKKDNELFLSISRPTLENLFSFVYGSGFNVAISSKDGVLLEVFGDNSSVESSKKGNWTPGADWSETSIGNNGIGTSIYLKKPIFIIGYEHYCRCCHYWASAAAPIFDSTRKVIGSIALCGPFEKIHKHTLGMIVAAAHDIEMQIIILNALKEREVFIEYQKILLNAIDEGVIGLDMNGNIMFCNQKTHDILKIKEGTLIGKNIDSLINCRNNNKPLSNVFETSVNKEIIFTINGHYIKCICSIQKIKDDGFIIMLSDYDYAIQAANKLISMNPNWTFNIMIGKNKKHLEMVNIAKKASHTDKSVLILGESGTGKDVFAKCIHNESYRKDSRYVAINCGAIPRNLIESELFGYADGAFTGAKKGGNIGKFEIANGGTIFLDEIGEMPLEQQVVLLRVLEESSFSRVGSSDKIPLNVRIIAATNKNIIEEVYSHRFRLDLFYRLNIFTINTIPLRERKDDIEELSNSFLQRLANKSGNTFTKLSKDILSIFMEYDWPGNIRELQNVLERAYALSTNGRVTSQMINLGTSHNNSFSFKKSNDKNENSHRINATVDDYKAITIKAELEKNKWNITKTCNSLNISRPTMYRWLKKYNIKYD